MSDHSTPARLSDQLIYTSAHKARSVRCVMTRDGGLWCSLSDVVEVMARPEWLDDARCLVEDEAWLSLARACQGSAPDGARLVHHDGLECIADAFSKLEKASRKERSRARVPGSAERTSTYTLEGVA
ncbi:hypothetical protein [Haematospirillum jordaniae]|uniref:hypothetical protein n=1 Tax=Haematospirillum jordaniae TaxID=1549855 RepID=UPI0014334527|nr:hypothetical protein [Haematospirillum jordaniae]NKD45001.1 hypothetical protein [Haematospirillum jordaniae]NKD84397.1 hypothetical protein [Haematospirillum jordaniae]